MIVDLQKKLKELKELKELQEFQVHLEPAAGVAHRRRRHFCVTSGTPKAPIFLDAGFEPTFLVFKVFLDFGSLCRRPRCGPGCSS